MPVTRTLPDLVYPPATGLPRHRAIVAVDIEQSTSRPDLVKAELRRTLYDLFDQALHSAGIHRRHRDRFTDRGDGLLALMHPVDQAAKPILLNRAIPALNQLLADYNASLPRAGRPAAAAPGPRRSARGRGPLRRQRMLRRGTRHRLPPARCPGVKKALRAAADPLALVVSGEIYQTIVRHGYEGIDPQAFRSSHPRQRRRPPLPRVGPYSG